MLRRWWERKFSLPWSDDRAQTLTLFELTKLYWEDVYANDPKMLLEAAKNERGDVIFEETGDPQIDKWEKEIAMGGTPDLTEGLSLVELAAMKREQAAVDHARAGMAALDAMSSDDGSPGSRAWALAAAMLPKGLGEGASPSLGPNDVLR